jgi:hypothetical protein
LKPVLILKKTHHKKRAGGVAQGVGPKFKPQYCKKKKTEEGLESDRSGFLCLGFNTNPLSDNYVITSPTQQSKGQKGLLQIGREEETWQAEHSRAGGREAMI